MCNVENADVADVQIKCKKCGKLHQGIKVKGKIIAIESCY